MSIGNDPASKRHRAKDLRKASSPGKLTSKAAKPSEVAAVATADATDLATTQALANELKAKMNELLASLKR